MHRFKVLLRRFKGILKHELTKLECISLSIVYSDNT